MEHKTSDDGCALDVMQNFTFSSNLIHHSLLALNWTASWDHAEPDLFCSTVFIFSYFSFFLILDRAVD